MKPPVAPPSPLSLYRAAQRQVRAERGEKCECCGVEARATHHIAPVASTGIASALFSAPENLLIVCADCHALFHPGERRYPWVTIGAARANLARKAAA